MHRSSLALRLVLGATVWTVAALGLLGLLLHQLFLDHVRRGFDAFTAEHLAALAAVAGIGPDGEFELHRLPVDPGFQRPGSGSYWQVVAPDGGLIRSPSLSATTLALPDAPAGGRVVLADGTGPRGEPLRLAVQRVQIEGTQAPAVLAVGFDSRELADSVRRFGWLLATSLLILGVGLTSAIFVQVRFGLAPLRRLSSELAEIRAGRRASLETDAPAELAPFSAEINALLNQVTQTIARARTHAGNLAHALKTPIAVLTNEAERIPGPAGVALQRQVQAMSRSVGHHLARARMAGAAGVLGMQTDVVAAAENIVRAMRQIHRERGLAIAIEGSGRPVFQGERQDCEEMLGNLIDNACKWAKTRVRISIGEEEAGIRIAVEDDGPGIAPKARQAVLARGGRLDEAVAGTGLGLAIVSELAALYGGSLTLGSSALGGLAVRLLFPMQPAADASNRAVQSPSAAS